MENEQAEIERCISFLKERGYSVVKRKEYARVSRCVCGEKRTHEGFSSCGIVRICSKCGLRGEPAATSSEAKINFNAAVEQARKESNDGNR